MNQKGLLSLFLTLVFCALVVKIRFNQALSPVGEPEQALAVQRLEVEERGNTRVGEIEIECLRVGQRLRLRVSNRGDETLYYRTASKYSEVAPEDIDLLVWSGGHVVFPLRTSGTFWSFGQASLSPGASIETTLWDAASTLSELEYGTPYFLGVRIVKGDRIEETWTRRTGWPLFSAGELTDRLALDFQQPGLVSSKLRSLGVSEMRILSLLTQQGGISAKDAVPHTQLPPEIKAFFLRAPSFGSEP